MRTGNTLERRLSPLGDATRGVVEHGSVALIIHANDLQVLPMAYAEFRTHALRQILRGCPYFRALPSAAVPPLAQIVEITYLAARTEAHHRGRQRRYVLMLLEGTVAVYISGRATPPQIANRPEVQAGHMGGQGREFLQKTRPHGLEDRIVISNASNGRCAACAREGHEGPWGVSRSTFSACARSLETPSYRVAGLQADRQHQARRRRRGHQRASGQKARSHRGAGPQHAEDQGARRSYGRCLHCKVEAAGRRAQDGYIRCRVYAGGGEFTCFVNG